MKSWAEEKVVKLEGLVLSANKEGGQEEGHCEEHFGNALF